MAWAGEARIHESPERDPGQSDEQAINILTNLCRLAAESFGEEQKPVFGDYILDQPPTAPL